MSTSMITAASSLPCSQALAPMGSVFFKWPVARIDLKPFEGQFHLPAAAVEFQHPCCRILLRAKRGEDEHVTGSFQCGSLHQVSFAGVLLLGPLAGARRRRAAFFDRAYPSPDLPVFIDQNDRPVAHLGAMQPTQMRQQIKNLSVNNILTIEQARSVIWRDHAEASQTIAIMGSIGRIVGNC